MLIVQVYFSANRFPYYMQNKELYKSSIDHSCYIKVLYITRVINDRASDKQSNLYTKWKSKTQITSYELQV